LSFQNFSTAQGTNITEHYPKNIWNLPLIQEVFTGLFLGICIYKEDSGYFPDEAEWFLEVIAQKIPE